MAGILNTVMNFGFFTAWQIPSLAEKLLASQEGLCYIKLLLFHLILCRWILSVVYSMFYVVYTECMRVMHQEVMR